MRKLALSDEILLSIQQPARYIGGEINSVCKDPSSVDVRFAMCFPDVYDIGMSHLGIQILYDMLNSRCRMCTVSGYIRRGPTWTPSCVKSISRFLPSSPRTR